MHAPAAVHDTPDKATPVAPAAGLAVGSTAQEVPLRTSASVAQYPAWSKYCPTATHGPPGGHDTLARDEVGTSGFGVPWRTHAGGLA